MEFNDDGWFDGARNLISCSESMWIIKIKYIYLYEWPRICICNSKKKNKKTTKKTEWNVVTRHARGVQNREDTKAGDIINLDILN